MNFEQLIETAWNEHGDRPHQVADRLAVLLPMITTGEQVAPFARIVTHVYGEHLGQCDRGIALLESVRRLPPYTDTPTVGGMVSRSIATLRYVAGDAGSVTRLSVEDRVAALATAASALTARAEWERALSAYAQAVELAPGLPEASPAFRALAIGGNNLSAALEEQLRRTEAQTLGMVAAARGALVFWGRAGTWLEKERALYRLARSLLAAGEPVEAIEHAKACVDVCNEHEAAPFERFFAWAVLARAYRESDRASEYRKTRGQALDWFDRVPDEDREWCEADLAELAY